MAATQRLSVKRKNFGQNASLSRANMIGMASAEYRLVCMILLYAIIFRSADLCIVIDWLVWVCAHACLHVCVRVCVCEWEWLHVWVEVILNCFVSLLQTILWRLMTTRMRVKPCPTGHQLRQLQVQCIYHSSACLPSYICVCHPSYIDTWISIHKTEYPERIVVFFWILTYDDVNSTYIHAHKNTPTHTTYLPTYAHRNKHEHMHIYIHKIHTYTYIHTYMHTQNTHLNRNIGACTYACM